MNLAPIPFKKMNGLGNDFVMIDARLRSVPISAAIAGAIADRSAGAGCDQLIVLEPSSRADVFMRVINADGSEVGACGNAARCVALLLSPDLGRNELSIETNSGILSARVAADGLVRVDMGRPRFAWHQIPLSQPFSDTVAIDLRHPLPDGRVLSAPSAVSVGNPHCIFWVNDDPDSYGLEAFGPALENHPLFPERANISLAKVLSRTAIKLRVWERGAGLTLACGTAACATAVAAARAGKTARQVEVRLPGGILSIEWREADDHILMTGPAEFEFNGILHLNGREDGVSYEVASRL